jgi:hypothetical protein
MNTNINFCDLFCASYELDEVLHTDITNKSIDQREAVKNFISEMVFGYELYNSFDMNRDIATYIYTGDDENTEMFGVNEVIYLNQYRCLCLSVCKELGVNHEDLKNELFAQYGTRETYVI